MNHCLGEAVTLEDPKAETAGHRNTTRRQMDGSHRAQYKLNRFSNFPGEQNCSLGVCSAHLPTTLPAAVSASQWSNSPTQSLLCGDPPGSLLLRLDSWRGGGESKSASSPGLDSKSLPFQSVLCWAGRTPDPSKLAPGWACLSACGQPQHPWAHLLPTRVSSSGLN